MTPWQHLARWLSASDSVTTIMADPSSDSMAHSPIDSRHTSAGGRKLYFYIDILIPLHTCLAWRFTHYGQPYTCTYPLRYFIYRQRNIGLRVLAELFCRPLVAANLFIVSGVVRNTRKYTDRCAFFGARLPRRGCHRRNGQYLVSYSKHPKLTVFNAQHRRPI